MCRFVLSSLPLLVFLRDEVCSVSGSASSETSTVAVPRGHWSPLTAQEKSEALTRVRTMDPLCEQFNGTWKIYDSGHARCVPPQDRIKDVLGPQRNIRWAKAGVSTLFHGPVFPAEEFYYVFSNKTECPGCDNENFLLTGTQDISGDTRRPLRFMMNLPVTASGGLGYHNIFAGAANVALGHVNQQYNSSSKNDNVSSLLFPALNRGYRLEVALMDTDMPEGHDGPGNEASRKDYFATSLAVGLNKRVLNDAKTVPHVAYAPYPYQDKVAGAALAEQVTTGLSVPLATANFIQPEAFTKDHPLTFAHGFWYGDGPARGILVLLLLHFLGVERFLVFGSVITHANLESVIQMYINLSKKFLFSKNGRIDDDESSKSYHIDNIPLTPISVIGR